MQFWSQRNYSEWVLYKCYEWEYIANKKDMRGFRPWAGGCAPSCQTVRRDQKRMTNVTSLLAFLGYAGMVVVSIVCNSWKLKVFRWFGWHFSSNKGGKRVLISVACLACAKFVRVGLSLLRGITDSPDFWRIEHHENFRSCENHKCQALSPPLKLGY